MVSALLADELADTPGSTRNDLFILNDPFIRHREMFNLLIKRLLQCSGVGLFTSSMCSAQHLQFVLDAGFQHFQPILAELVVQLGQVCNEQDVVEADVAADHRVAVSQSDDHARSFYTT